MRVVFVLPPFDIASAYGSMRKMQRGNLPPLGVGYLAACLKMAGHTPRLVDAVALGTGLEETVTKVLQENPEITREFKRQRPEIPVVLGGPHAASFAEEVLIDCDSIDVLVPGEGEIVLTQLVDRLSRGAGYEDVPGLIFRDESGAVRAMPMAPLVEDLDTIPDPARDIYQPELYLPLPNQCRQTPATTVITARGCPWGRCAFCYQGGRYSPPYRRRSPAHVVNEIARLAKDGGIREIIFWDDNFCVSPKWVHSFCDLLDREKLGVTWSVQGRVNTVTEAMLRRMAQSGCYNIYYGFESGNQEILDLVNKGITLEQSRAAVKWAKKAGMEIRGSFILGMPTETPEMAEKTIRFACELNVDWMIFYPYRVQKGTALEALALREGALLGNVTSVHVPSYVPNTYAGPEQLAHSIRSAYRRYYLRPRYAARALRRSRSWTAVKNNARAFALWLNVQRAKKAKA